MDPPLGGELEMRRDRVASSGNVQYRIYLDNFDQLQRFDRKLAEQIQGTPSREVELLRQAYEEHQLPTHPKKSVEQQLGAEIQGAWLDGDKGTCRVKPSKIAKYVGLILSLLREGKASQKELQVVGGGMVYISMFKRQILGSLNQIWRDIVSFEKKPTGLRLPLRQATALELARFVGLVPLAFFDLRCGVDPLVSVSDASTTGGGFCVSRGVSPYGMAAALSSVRGDLPEEHDFCQVLTIGLFDGISGLRIAMDILGAPLAGHISIEKNPDARRVTEANFGDVIHIEDVMMVDYEMVQSWALRFSSVGVIVVGAGPPCQGVSGLNADRRGALRDSRSCLYTEVPRIEQLVRRAFPWAQVHRLAENVASMDWEDCQLMCEAFEDEPYFIDACGVSLCSRPRLYWVSWELLDGDGVEFLWGTNGKLPVVGEVKLTAEVDEHAFLEKGWSRHSTAPLPTLLLRALRRPRTGEFRPPSINEREVILGFPCNYTVQCLKKALRNTEQHKDARLTLLGNSWSVPVVSWLLSCLLAPLGLISPISLQELIFRFTPGKAQGLQTLLMRPPLARNTQTFAPSALLVKKLVGLVSLKGEDLLLHSASDIPVRYHRLRASERYNNSLQQFYAYLRREDVRLPSRRDLLDGIVSDYLEHLWSEGEGTGKDEKGKAESKTGDPATNRDEPRLMTFQDVPGAGTDFTEDAPYYDWKQLIPPQLKQVQDMGEKGKNALRTGHRAKLTADPDKPAFPPALGQQQQDDESKEVQRRKTYLKEAFPRHLMKGCSSPEKADKDNKEEEDKEEAKNKTEVEKCLALP
eukprot:Skav214090  [mRNA]  locus=scaffold5449:51559:56206:+ [translate_table: standard]